MQTLTDTEAKEVVRLSKELNKEILECRAVLILVNFNYQQALQAYQLSSETLNHVLNCVVALKQTNYNKEEAKKIVKEIISDDYKVKQIKELRKLTGLGMLECKHQLQQSNWDIVAAYKNLERKTCRFTI